MSSMIPRFLLAAGLVLPLLAPAAPLADGGSPAGNSAPAREMKQHHGQQGHHGKRGHRHDRDGKPFFLRGITLSAEQDGKLQALLKAQQPALQAKREAAHRARQALRQLTLSGRFDEQQAQRLARASADAMAEADVQKARSHAQIVQMLTPEQRQQMEKNLQERAAQHEAKMKADGDAH